MFTRTDVARIARLASLAVEGSGTGATAYDEHAMRGRYVVGGYAPAQLYPIGEGRGHMRTRIWDWVQAHPEAHTLGYWEHEGTVYVDLGTMTPGLEYALQLARTRGELAIFDRHTGECIPVNAD